MATTAVTLAGTTVDVLDAVPRAWDLLDDAERGRAAGFRHEADRSDYVAAHALLRVALRLGAPQLKGAARITRSCGDCGSTGHGAPRLLNAPGTSVSLSHTRGYVSAGVGPRRVGTDVEPVSGGARRARLHHLVLSPAEARAVSAAACADRAFVRCWVRKESLVKMGLGSLDRLRELDTSPLPVDRPGPGDTLWSTFGAFHVLDWSDPRTDVAGSTIAEHPPRLLLLERAGQRVRLRRV